MTGNEGNVKENWRRKRVPAFDLNSVENHNSRTKGETKCKKRIIPKQCWSELV